MSDGYSDMIEYFKEAYNKYLDLLFQFHHYYIINQHINNVLFWELSRRLSSIPQSFFSSEFKLPSHLMEELKLCQNDRKVPSFVSLLFLLIIAGRISQVISLQKLHPEYNNKLLLFFNERGQLLPNGVHYQNRFWHFLDGDQDIMLGYAKKRCHRQPFAGEPVLLVAEQHRYRRHCFVLKEVLDIYGKSLIPPK